MFTERARTEGPRAWLEPLESRETWSRVPGPGRVALMDSLAAPLSRALGVQVSRAPDDLAERLPFLDGVRCPVWSSRASRGPRFHPLWFAAVPGLPEVRAAMRAEDIDARFRAVAGSPGFHSDEDRARIVASNHGWRHFHGFDPYSFVRCYQEKPGTRRWDFHQRAEPPRLVTGSAWSSLASRSAVMSRSWELSRSASHWAQVWTSYSGGLYGAPLSELVS